VTVRPLSTALALCLGLPLIGPLGAVASAGPACVAPTVLYVSPTGDDHACGTREAPLRRPQVAVDRIARGGTVLLLPGTYTRQRVLIQDRHDLTVAATTPGQAVLDESGLVPADGDSGAVQIEDSTRITVRGLDIRDYRTTSMAKVPIGIYVTGHGSRITLAHNHVHRLGNFNTTLGSFDINAHGIAAYGRDPKMPITRLRIHGNEVDHLHLGASESVVVNGNVTHWRITANRIHDDNNIGIDAIGWEGTVPGKHRYTKVDQARRGVIAGNTVRRIISKGNPSYWEGDGWCNCADGIYIDGAGHVDVRDNVVTASDIAIEVGAENPRGYSDAVRVRGNRVSGSRYVGLALGGYSPSRGEVYGVRVTGNHFRDDNTLRDGSPELLLQFHLHETTIAHNTVVATHRSTPLLLQRARLVGGRRLNAHVRLDHNRYRAPVPAGRATFIWLGRMLTGFGAYVHRSSEDRHSSYHPAG
jgi:Right handed beta helix region